MLVESIEEELASDKDEAKKLIQSGTLELGAITIHGGVQQDHVKQILEQQKKILNQCVNKGLRKHPGPPGEMIITFVVDSKGHVADVRIDQSELKNEKIEQCILKTMKKLTFPAFADGKEATVTVTFYLKKD